MSKAKTLATTVSTGGVLADGTVAAAEVSGLAAVATSGAYSDLSGRPTLAAVATTGAYSDLSGRPTLAAVATSGAYGDLSGRPTLPSGTIVGTSDAQTLTNKTIEAGTFTNGYTEETVTANTGTAYTIDLLNGTVQILTLTGNCTFTFPTATAGRSFFLFLRQDATGSRTVSWPASVRWPGGTAPTITATANRLDKYVFTADGTNWYGSNAGQNYTV